MDSKNIVIITSCMISNENSGFSKEERFNQTLQTIKSVKEKIPNNFIILLEGSNFKYNYGIDYYFYYDVSKFKKSQGEAILIYNCLNSNFFKQLNINTVSKISGRYFLNDNFIWNDSKFVIKKDKGWWNNTPGFLTRFYTIPNKYINEFKSIIFAYINSYNFKFNIADIETNLYMLNTIKDYYSPEILGVSGYLSISKQFISD